MSYGSPRLSIASDGRGFLFSPQAGGIYFTPDFGRSWTPVKSRYNPYLTAALTLDIHQSGFGLIGFEERVEVVRIFSKLAGSPNATI